MFNCCNKYCTYYYFSFCGILYCFSNKCPGHFQHTSSGHLIENQLVPKKEKKTKTSCIPLLDSKIMQNFEAFCWNMS